MEGAQGSHPPGAKAGLDRSGPSMHVPSVPDAHPPALEVFRLAILTLGRPQQLQTPPQQGSRHGSAQPRPHAPRYFRLARSCRRGNPSGNRRFRVGGRQSPPSLGRMR